MTVFTIIANLFQSIPGWLRTILLTLFAVAFIANEVCRIFEADLPFDKIDRALLYIGGYLSIQSVANTPPVVEKTGGEHRAVAHP